MLWTLEERRHCADLLEVFRMYKVYSRFPDGYFPGWFFPRKDVSRVVIFPDEAISYD